MIAAGVFVDASVFASFGVFAGLALAETIWPDRRSLNPIGRRWFGNLGLYVLSGALLALPKVAALSTAIVADDPNFGLLNWLDPTPVIHALLALLAFDAISYASHRLSHCVGVLWRLHAVHHSDPDLDVTTTLRHHPIEALWIAALSSSALPVIGIGPGEVAAYTLLEWFVQSAAHTNLSLPARVDSWLRHIIVTPGFHRCHHSRDLAETNTNYGQAFAFWDTLFGTRCRAGAYWHQTEFGLDDFRDVQSQGLYQLLTQPLKQRRAAPVAQR